MGVLVIIVVIAFLYGRSKGKKQARDKMLFEQWKQERFYDKNNK